MYTNPIQHKYDHSYTCSSRVHDRVDLVPPLTVESLGRLEQQNGSAKLWSGSWWHLVRCSCYLAMPPATSSRVLVLADGAAVDCESTLKAGSLLEGFVQLPCPATGQLQQYLVRQRTLQEVQRFKSTHSSWLVGDSVVSDGALYLCNPVDPLLLLLPHLQGHQYTDAATLCTLSSCPAASCLEELCRPHLPCICDVKQYDEEVFYRLNEQKALTWLGLKIQQVAASLQQVVPGATAGSSPPEVQQYALGLLGEYLAPAWATKLAQYLGCQPCGTMPNTTPAARSAPGGPDPMAASQEKKHRVEDAKPVVDAREAAKKKAAASRAESQRAKFAEQAAGSKRISAFFAKKP